MLTNRLRLTRRLWLWAWLPLVPVLGLALYGAYQTLAQMQHITPDRVVVAKHILTGIDICLPLVVAALFLKKRWREQQLKRDLNSLSR